MAKVPLTRFKYTSGRDYLLSVLNEDANPDRRLKAGIALVNAEYRGVAKVRTEKAKAAIADSTFAPSAVPPRSLNG